MFLSGRGSFLDAEAAAGCGDGPAVCAPHGTLGGPRTPGPGGGGSRGFGRGYFYSTHGRERGGVEM